MLVRKRYHAASRNLNVVLSAVRRSWSGRGIALTPPFHPPHDPLALWEILTLAGRRLGIPKTFWQIMQQEMQMQKMPHHQIRH